MKKEIVIRSDGSIAFVHDDKIHDLLKPLGSMEKKRASHVEPINMILRDLFHLIRSIVSDKSIIANWTRRWPCMWQARIIDGPVLGPYRDRLEAIADEVNWLKKNKLG